jgi:hypothetical protein
VGKPRKVRPRPPIPATARYPPSQPAQWSSNGVPLLVVEIVQGPVIRAFAFVDCLPAPPRITYVARWTSRCHVHPPSRAWPCTTTTLSQLNVCPACVRLEGHGVELWLLVRRSRCSPLQGASCQFLRVCTCANMQRTAPVGWSGATAASATRAFPHRTCTWYRASSQSLAEPHGRRRCCASR